MSGVRHVVASGLALVCMCFDSQCTAGLTLARTYDPDKFVGIGKLSVAVQSSPYDSG